MSDIALTEEEKSRIRAEEIFRTEVARELSAARAPSKRNRIWTFVNSAFALWFLSSVVLASVTAAFARYQADRGQQIRNAELQRHLDTEISGRIASAFTGLRINRSRIETGAVYDDDDIYTIVVAYLDNFFIVEQSNPRDFSIYPEYQKRTFRSLIFELTSIVDESAVSELRDALAAYEELSERGNTGTPGALNRRQKMTAKEKAILAIQQSEDILKTRLTKARWRARF